MLHFHELPTPTAREVQSVLEELVCRLGRVLVRHGIADTDAEELTDSLLSACYASSVRGRAAFGPRAGRKPVPVGAAGDSAWTERRRNQHAELEGFDLHAAVRVAPEARDRLEQLLTADELLQRLVALIPRPEKNLLIYHGVLAPNAKWRKAVTAYGRPHDHAAVL